MNDVGRLNVDFVDSLVVGQVSFRDNDEFKNVDFGEYRIIDSREHYDGDYEVEPSAFDDVVLETKNRVMDDDVTIKKIYSAEVSNPSGGNTYYIASSIGA